MKGVLRVAKGLKPCPFCGDTPRLSYGSSLGDSYSEGMETNYIWCDCGIYIEVDYEESKETLTKTWNHRTPII